MSESSNVKIGIAEILEKIAEESKKGVLTHPISSLPDDSENSKNKNESFASPEEQNHQVQPIEVSFENIYKSGNLENLAFRCEQAMNNPDLTEEERIIAQLWWCKGQLKAQLIPPVVLYAPVDRATKFLEDLDSKGIKHTTPTISLAKEVLSIFCNELLANKEYDLLYSFETRLKKLDKKFFKKYLDTIEDFKKGLLKTPYFELTNEEQLVKKDVEKEKKAKNKKGKKKKKEETTASVFPEELPPPVLGEVADLNNNSNDNAGVVERKKNSGKLSTLLRALLIFIVGLLVGGVSVKFIPERVNFYFFKEAKVAKEQLLTKEQNSLNSLMAPQVSRAPLPGSLQMLKYIEKDSSVLKNSSEKKLPDTSYTYSSPHKKATLSGKKEVVNTDSPVEPKEVREIIEGKKKTSSVKASGIFPQNFVDGRPSSQRSPRGKLLGYFRTLVFTPVRIDPDYLAPVIGNLPPNVTVRAIERRGEWLVIYYGRYKGYIFAQDVVPER
ncbi:MAG: SH3 domain-containing protein [Candidatus Dadabacteria bacterium]|nr:MAG: SH3 domain-containing protein [Candidatus Dadabacteria bacterium]